MRTPRQINAVFHKIINSNMSPRVKALKLRALLREIKRSFNIPNDTEEIQSLYLKILDNITE